MQKIRPTNLKTANRPSLYIHIPFCSHLCHYCDFTKFFYQKKWIDAYLTTLQKEIASFQQTSFLTIYIGGGTPTSLDTLEFKRLLQIVKPYIKDTREYTVECNIESTTKEKLLLMRQYGVNRLSFGVQSSHDERLKEIGRHHQFQDVITTIESAKKVGFTKMSVDLIYGLPHQSLEELNVDIDRILSLEVDHISTYSLTIHPHTKAYIDRWPSLSDDRSRDYYDAILKRLTSEGFHRYEVSNFARPGYESLHNHIYWYSLPFYGAGYGASGYLINHQQHLRYRNIGKFSDYLKGDITKEQEVLDADKQELEYLMNNLRLAEGFDLSDYHQRFGVDFLTRYQPALHQLVKLGLMNVDTHRISCTDEGLIKLDFVLFKLM